MTPQRITLSSTVAMTAIDGKIWLFCAESAEGRFVSEGELLELLRRKHD
jgi:hypothetical protein